MSSATLPPPDVTEPVDDAVPEVSDGWGPYRPWVRVGVVGLLVVGVVLRFVTRSPMWLDEALSVNIARLPLGDIPEALRHDGHPPLYYFLLHVWMDVFGEGDVAVRALSGLWGLALIPLTWFAGRRLGGERVAWIATLLVAVSPFAIRYSTETRMYSMVMVLVLAACLIGQDALRDPKPWRLAVLAVLVGALLLSHYWSMYLLASIGLMLLWRLRSQHRAGDLEGRRADDQGPRGDGRRRRPLPSVAPDAALPGPAHRHAVGVAAAARRGDHPDRSRARRPAHR